MTDDADRAVDFWREGKKSPPRPKPMKWDNAERQSPLMPNPRKARLSERAEDSVMDALDRAEDKIDKIEDVWVAGTNFVKDQHYREIPAEIGGNTISWSDLNPFKNPFKNGKLR